MKFHRIGRTCGNIEDTKNRSWQFTTMLWRRKRVLRFQHHLKLTHFTLLVYLRYCLITTKIWVQALVPVVVRWGDFWLYSWLQSFVWSSWCLGVLIIQCWGISLSSAIKPFTSWDLPSCPARLVSIFQQQMDVLHNHRRADLQGDRTVQQDGEHAKKDVTKTHNNATFRFVHCMLVRIVPTTSAGWGRRWQHHVVSHHQIFTLYLLFISVFTLPHFLFHCLSFIYRYLSSCKLIHHQLLNPF